MIPRLLLPVLLTLWATLAQSHALQPGYLEMRALGQDTWSVFWRKPDVRGQPMDLHAVLPENCVERGGPESQFDGAGWSSRWITTCPGGLDGGTFTVDGLAGTRTDVLVRYELAPGQGQAWRLVPSSPSYTIPPDPGAWEVLRSYLSLGVEHILLGADHLLFVLTLLLLIANIHRLIGAVTAFTLAHSVTLGAAALGFLDIPGPPVEAAIALSILFVASEVLHARSGPQRLSQRLPWLVSFGFGLVHGLGFGSALKEIGLPQSEIVLALLAFNIGVELGQLLFIAASLLLWSVARRAIRAGLVPRLETALVYAIGSVAAFWVFERLAGFA